MVKKSCRKPKYFCQDIEQLFSPMTILMQRWKSIVDFRGAKFSHKYKAEI